MTCSGRLFIISAPSGAGKTSLVKFITNELTDLELSISYTTRSSRPYEQHGIDYFFVSRKEFLNLKAQGAFLESYMVFGNYYGTSKALVSKALAAGKDLVLEIDWQGAKQVKQALLNEPKLFEKDINIAITTIFILPPSLQTLASRLISRDTDSAENIKTRLNKAKQEISHYTEYDYLIINNEFQTAAQELMLVIKSQRLKTARQQKLYRNLIDNLLL